MSVSFGCNCEERVKPVGQRNWEVWQRQCNYSYFESPKGQWHPSKYSLVFCKTCEALGRTKALYVCELDDKLSD